MLYLLDTNIISWLLRDPTGPVIRHMQRVGESKVCTSILVAAELRFGATRRGSTRLSAQVEGFLARTEVLPFTAPADVMYGELRALLERLGQPIGANDLFIASHALALGCTLVTDNEREFARVPGLVVENWLRQ